jgi:nitrate/TMAO reductase-like tetraheme cytochrome c subunit
MTNISINICITAIALSWLAAATHGQPVRQLGEPSPISNTRQEPQYLGLWPSTIDANPETNPPVQRNIALAKWLKANTAEHSGDAATESASAAGQGLRYPLASLPPVCVAGLPVTQQMDDSSSTANPPHQRSGFGYPSPHEPGVPSQGGRSWNDNPHSSASRKLKAMAGNELPCDDPHAAVFSSTDFPSAIECATCHQQIYDEWAVSSHAYAAVSPMFHVFEDKINQLSQGTIGYFCIRCHAPVATTMGQRRDQAIWDGPQVFREGVTCVACHRVKYPYTKANGERRIEPGDIHDPVYGSGDGRGVELVIKNHETFKVKTDANDKGLGQSIHRRSIQFEELKESTFCMSCHQVAVQPGIKLEVVWDQYRASPACREGVSCQDCHMGKVPGMDEGYTVGPSAIVNEKQINPERLHSNHIFHGPGYSIAHPGVFPQSKEALRWSFNDWQMFDWRSGWGTKEFEDAVASGQSQGYFPPTWSILDDRMDAREIIEKNLKALAAKDENRRQVLENGSKVDGPFFDKEPKVGQPLQLYYCVTNTNPGHNMPSGSLGAQPQIWVNVVLIDPQGQRIWESGYLDSQGDLADIHSSDVLNRRIALDTQLVNFQSKFLTTNVKGTDREMYLPVNVDFDQLPFLRPAPQPVSVINHPVGIRMEAHSLPPLGSRQAKYVVPASCLSQPGTYRLSVRMRSRLEPIYFMRFCNATPEMTRNMIDKTMDFHMQSVVFEVCE